MELPSYRLTTFGITWTFPRFSYVVSPTLSDQYVVCVFFQVKHESPLKTIRFRDFSDVNTEGFAENIDAEFLFCSPSVSNPNEYLEYMVNFMKKKNW